MEEGRLGNVLLGVTGSIAAYKSAEIVRLFVKQGCDVKVILTENGARFITAETLATLSRNPVYCEMFPPVHNEEIEHIALSDWADVLLVAPATANIIGKFAAGVADDLLSTTFLSCDCPVVIAPAMNVRMFAHQVVQENVQRLERLGVVFVGPESGELACGTSGKGRMSAPEKIVEAVASFFHRARDYEGINMLVTAGPTREMIDPVRFISNRSSGKMGLAMASVALRRGANVTLIMGPTAVAPPNAAKVVNVLTAQQMREAVFERLAGQHIVIMAAAVADYRPTEALSQKEKKRSDEIILKLVPTPDILKELGQSAKKDKVLVGFAAETENLQRNARQKLLDKNLDLIVANDVSSADAGFEVDTNAAVLLWRDGREDQLGKTTKTELADRILDEVLQLTRQKLGLHKS